MLDPGRFAVRTADVRGRGRMAFVREGPRDGDGFPLLLVHGWPETKRIWWRAVQDLADAGFEVIVPDLLGFGDSDVPADGFADLAAHARDVHALVHDVLGHERCAAAGGDLGGGIVQDLALRFEGFVVRQVLFNTILPLLAELAGETPPEVRMAADYFARQGRDAEALAASLRDDEERIRYVEAFYGSRFWAAPGGFDRDAARFHAEPFADPVKLRASFANYESALGTRPLSEPPRWFEPNPVEALVLYGPEDHVLWRDFPERCEVVFPNLVGPFVVRGAGHFLPWERARLFNRAVVAFLRDLTAGGGTVAGP